MQGHPALLPTGRGIVEAGGERDATVDPARHDARRTAQHYGLRVRSITLWLLGGVSELDGDPRADLAIALAGPAASLVSAGVLVLAAGLWRIRGDRAAARQAAARTRMTFGVVLAAAGLVLMLYAGAFDGLWLVLLGWYLTGAARAEAAALRFTGRLGDIPAGRLMSAPPICGYPGQTATAFAAVHPHRCYPVLDIDGNLAGVVTIAGLTRVPPRLRSETRLAERVVPISRMVVTQRETPLRDPSALPAGPLHMTVVLDGRRPCGVLAAGDLSRALAVTALGATPDRAPGTLGDLQPLP